MAEATTLHDAFIDELRDTYDAEKQLTKALPKLAKAASSPDLRAAFADGAAPLVASLAQLRDDLEAQAPYYGRDAVRSRATFGTSTTSR